MAWEVEYTDEFEAWWDALTAEEQESVSATVELLERLGPDLRHPYSSGIEGSKHGRMRELRCSTKVGRFECSTPSTHGGLPFC
jgi:hypothetical protein